MAQILIIEDNLTNMQLMAYLLHSFGHTVSEAPDAATGLARAAEMPDLILCDVQLPDLDGYQIARHLKSHPVLCSIPLVAVTALAMVGDRDRVMAAGFDGYLAKPIEPETFVGQVEAFLAVCPPGTSPPYVSAPLAQAGELTRSGSTVADGRTVLVVDNLTVNLDLARSILEPFGYQVLTAHSIAEGLAIARAEPCDLILSDVCIGSETGPDFLRAILADTQLRSVPVIFITSTRVDDETRMETLALGAARYLIRPIEPEVLLAEIEACLAESLEERKVSDEDYPDH